MLKTQTFLLQIGQFVFQITTDILAIRDYLLHHYQQALCVDNNDHFIDFQLGIMQSKGVRRFIKPQANFIFNNQKRFNPAPIAQAPALLEWGMNWIIATQAHQYLILHAATLEKEDKGIIITAPSGSGKSTLCAYLVSQGWRLLSDEQALVNLETLQLHAQARPVSLKNGAIELIKPLIGARHFSTSIQDNEKGRISLMKAPLSAKQAHKTTDPSLIVFVSYNPNEPLYFESVDKAVALTEVIKNSFNFGLLNTQGFMCAKNLLDKCDCIYLEYHDLLACEQLLCDHLSLSKSKAFEKVSRCTEKTHSIA